MKKTFYTVEYNTRGSDSLETAWFNSKPAADTFSRMYHADRPHTHCYTRPDSIREAERNVFDTECWMMRIKA